MRVIGKLFAAPMVTQLLARLKTQTRREMKMGQLISNGRPNKDAVDSWRFDSIDGFADAFRARDYYPFAQLKSPGVAGDHLYVRETWRTDARYDSLPPGKVPRTAHVEYTAGPPLGITWAPGKCRPSIFMPRWASRITLELTQVRVERLQDISEADAKAEGITEEALFDGTRCFRWPGSVVFPTARAAYLAGWDTLNGVGAAAKNPWVWVLSFKNL